MSILPMFAVVLGVIGLVLSIAGAMKSYRNLKALEELSRRLERVKVAAMSYDELSDKHKRAGNFNGQVYYETYSLAMREAITLIEGPPIRK